MNETADVPTARLRPYAAALQGLLLAGFLVLCWHYASGLNLWGDEAYSLDFVEGQTSVVDPSHLPTYYALLKLLTSTVPGTNEPVLRMLHAVAFALGLLFGTLAVRRITHSSMMALTALGVAVLLPDFHFYATNLRMYSLVFLATMANVDALSRLVDRDRPPMAAAFAWYVVSGAALVAIDFPGLFYFAVGAAYLAVNGLRSQRWMLLPVLLLPLLPLLAFCLANPSLFADLLRWRPDEASDSVGGSFNALKLIYLALRPGLDLVYAATLPSTIALILPPVLFAVILLAALHQAVGARGQFSGELLIPLLALCWIALVPTGFTFTRIFLPSQFLMVVVLIRAIHSRGEVLRGTASVATVVLVLVNLYQALLPTYRLDSTTPYRQIADDVAAASAAEGIDTVMASDNSLNVESIYRYMRPHAAGRGLRLLTVTDAELVRRAAELGGRPFLFISHMGGGGPFVDIHQLTGRAPQLFRGYVSLHDLPYNDLWRRRYAQRAGQPDAVDVWIVR